MPTYECNNCGHTLAGVSNPAREDINSDDEYLNEECPDCNSGTLEAV